MEHQTWTWPDSLDTLVAASGFHRRLFENDVFRAGDADRRRRDDRAAPVQVDTRNGTLLPQPGTAVWSDTLPPHRLESIDTSPIHVIGFEVEE